jgi:hypothetical protein
MEYNVSFGDNVETQIPEHSFLILADVPLGEVVGPHFILRIRTP